MLHCTMKIALSVQFQPIKLEMAEGFMMADAEKSRPLFIITPLLLNMGWFSLKLYVGFILNILIIECLNRFIPHCYWCLSTDVVLVAPEMGKSLVLNTWGFTKKYILMGFRSSFCPICRSAVIAAQNFYYILHNERQASDYLPNGTIC